MAKTASKLRLTLLDDRVLVKPNEADAKSKGGIVLPEGSRRRPSRGKVVSVGPGKQLPDGSRAAMTVQLGDEVIYGEWDGNRVELGEDHEEFLLLVESNILAIIPNAG